MYQSINGLLGRLLRKRVPMMEISRGTRKAHADGYQSRGRLRAAGQKYQQMNISVSNLVQPGQNLDGDG